MLGQTDILRSDHIKTYLAFGGDADAWARSDPRQDMSDAHWTLIEEFRQALLLIDSGLASNEFAARTERRLMELTESEEARRMLRDLSRDAPKNSLPVQRPRWA